VLRADARPAPCPHVFRLARLPHRPVPLPLSPALTLHRMLCSMPMTLPESTCWAASDGRSDRRDACDVGRDVSSLQEATSRVPLFSSSCAPCLQAVRVKAQGQREREGVLRRAAQTTAWSGPERAAAQQRLLDASLSRSCLRPAHHPPPCSIWLAGLTCHRCPLPSRQYLVRLAVCLASR
jgi:hypothetical protein